jgi:hypothetical protein
MRNLDTSFKKIYAHILNFMCNYQNLSVSLGIMDSVYKYILLSDQIERALANIDQLDHDDRVLMA